MSASEESSSSLAKSTSHSFCVMTQRVLNWDAFNHDSPAEAEVATEERDNFFHILYDYSNTIVNMSEKI